MKSDVIQYVRVYQQLKNKIESGLIPVGSRLPGRSVLCREFGTSERTVRRVLELLEQDGLLAITPKKRPVVISAFAAPEGREMKNTKKADAAQVNDLLQTGILLCYPIYMRGLRLCTGEEWHTPDLILDSMNPEKPGDFWRLSTRLWRFFISRNENELLLRVVDSLGFRGKEPSMGSLEERRQYRSHIEKLFRNVKSGREPGWAELEAIFSQYRLIAALADEVQFHQVLSPCPMLAKADGLEQKLCLAQERYSAVCLDLLGLIATGRYQPGDRLPTHEQLQEYYHVSRDTSVKAIHMLRNWGVVTAAPHKGIFVEMDLEALQRIPITPESIACHVRRYLDSLDLLALTVGSVSSHAAVHVEAQDAECLRTVILRQWEQPEEYQLIPRTLLEFITKHIQYDALRTIYGVLVRNLSIGRSIPKLVSPGKNPRNCGIYRLCIQVADLLIDGKTDRVAAAASEVFEQVQSIVSSECRRLGYWEAAMKVYNGETLWK